ncbi:universal stress protein [Gordonia sp. TBRC 11910]|uniref:Universal stress protein n=1 Tax=Gordonia asplenii TaxID=2725283 RepID=A0A848L0V9_9ACTN|nr:universal stress protein [Gordonia asplenii]NMO02705.1 universal stress protein [Gordonia asplenii]
MTIVAGFSAARRGTAPVELAAQIARTTGEQIVAVAIVERRRPPKSDPIEDEYLDYLTTDAERALHGAVDALPAGTGITVEVRAATSIPTGLAQFATEQQASVVTVGSSSTGLLGRVALGSVTDRVVHGSAVPIAIAPRGYASGGGPVRRLTAAFGGQADVNGLIPAAAALAKKWGVGLRVVSFTARDVSAYAMATPKQAENLVVDRWWQNIQDDITKQLDTVRSTVGLPDVEVAVGVGPDWRAAVESVQWGPGDVLVLGSGAAAQTQQVFLGSVAARIVRNSPVPVMILPRPAT